MNGILIVSVKAWQSNAETFHIVKASYFADCSGDSILAPLTNAEFMYGREAKVISARLYRRNGHIHTKPMLTCRTRTVTGIIIFGGLK